MFAPKARIAAIVVLVIAALSSVPSVVAAKKKAPPPFPGTISMTAPMANDAVRGTTHVSWAFRPGAYVKSTTSRLNFQISSDGTTWQTVAGGLPIRNGSFDWDTTFVGDSVYATRVIVDKTTIAGAQKAIFLDNSKPVVRIVRPSKSGPSIDDQRPAGDFAIVAGVGTLDAAAFDALSGITKVEWSIDGTKLEGVTGAQATYDFGQQTPGFHDLLVTATDRAGNSQSDTIQIFTTPGPSKLGPSPIGDSCPVSTPDGSTTADPCGTAKNPPASCPVPNPAGGNLADPCGTKTPTPPSTDSCPVSNPVDNSTVADPCTQELPNPGDVKLPDPPKDDGGVDATRTWVCSAPVAAKPCDLAP